MFVELSIPEEFSGVISNLVQRRNGVIINSDGLDGWFTVTFEAPLNDMFGFSSELRSATQGKGEYTMEYSRYAPTTPAVQSKIVDQYQQSLAGGGTQGGSDKKKKKKN